MSKFSIVDSMTYRWRYQIGYGIMIVALLSLLFVAGFLIPGSISSEAEQSIIAASSLSSEPLLQQSLVNAPFYLLENISLSLFGVTLLGIKLPALILALITAICMALLLRRWFSGGIAVLASLLVVTTGQFLFLAQSGSTGILYLFWPTLLLLFATLVANRARFHGIWKLLLFTCAALSLYTPLSLYVLIAMGSAIFIHPHLRHIIRKLPKWRIAAGSTVAFTLLVPLIYNIIRDPSVGLSLLGIPASWPNIFTNLQILFGQYFGFMTPGMDSVLLPIFGLASMLIILYGLVRLIKTYETVQSHIVLAWIVLLLPVLIVNPTYVSIMFVPLLLLLASGLEGILRRWYKLFPKNPYARVTGLVPLVILVSSMVLFGLERYAYSYRYSPTTMHNFSRDILIIPDTQTLVVAEQEAPLYRAVASYHGQFAVVTQHPKSGVYASTARAFDASKTPVSIITSERSRDGARFYLYK